MEYPKLSKGLPRTISTTLIEVKYHNRAMEWGLNIQEATDNPTPKPHKSNGPASWSFMRLSNKIGSADETVLPCPSSITGTLFAGTPSFLVKVSTINLLP